MSNLNITNREQVSDRRAAAQVTKTYVEWREAFPLAEPTVRIIFHGLFCFFFDRKDDCFVGTHNTTQQSGHPHTTHPHDYRIIIRQKHGDTIDWEIPYPGGNPQSYPRLNIKVMGSAFPGGVEPGVYVYTGPNHDQFFREVGNDRRDWRWIIDFEGIVYPGGVSGINAAALRPGIRIDNGLFYTFHKTLSNYDLVAEGSGTSITLNNVADIMAANIYLAAGGSVRVTGGPVGERTLNFEEGRTYEIDILNLCDGHAHEACHYEPTHLDKQRRNDFFLYYDTFDASQNRPEYLLINRMDVIPADDDTPCGAVAFDQTPQI
jgi:hypothetical protein